MDAKILAMMLTGREYGSEIDHTEEHQAKAAGLVVAFGASDDLLELRGAIHDEEGAYGGTKIRVDAQGTVPTFESVLDDGDKDALRKYFKRENGGVEIKAAWEGEPGYSWIISTSIPHETFEIVEDGEPYCRGIVFALADVPAGTASAGPGVKQMVDRFLGWKLPATFCPDCYISFDGAGAQSSTSWPTGTNLLNAEEARAMFEHVLRDPAA